MADTFVAGHDFTSATGLKTGAQLNDLVTQATLTNGSTLLDQATLETYQDGSVYRARVADGMGLPTRAAACSFWAYANAAQTIADQTHTKVTLNTESYDAAGTFAANRWTPTTAGIYMVSSQVLCVRVLTTDNIYFWLRKNALAIPSLQLSPGPAASLFYMNGTTDYLELWCYQQEGKALTILDGELHTFMTGTLLTRP